ncbi:hypothetical protein GCM10010168_34050 [Actinoplanes ianthinogenes]|uniref:Uncharacterized protein n=1 Tax=Actinoplanes ianthinogenes TaxID=122358 RepID=A0ABN6CPK0_9ACTN|nr:hypothetical protein [Actinoplanes ianthinogenes]BCJ47075.1 hypothetical protein Aiant_77320 [Actinoplanes ianthinogenes]GGR13462.1 hypothetical protein GCM10010168_34050 [Actinoplanes ianthinogenes]
MTGPVSGADDRRGRLILGFGVVGAGFVGVIAISIVAIGFAPADKRPDMAQLVFTAVLPLLGAWVATVLAFYFAGDNLRTATQSTIDAMKAAGGLAPDTPATQVMLTFEQIDPKQVIPEGAAAGDLKLKLLYDAMHSANRSRVPIFDHASVALCVVHDSDLDKYAQAKSLPAASMTDADTLAALMAQSPEMTALVKNFLTVPATATVADVRTRLTARPGCKDVFVTAGGGEADKVLGWLTHSNLARVQ